MEAMPWIIWLAGVAIGFAVLGAANAAGKVNGDDFAVLAPIMFWPLTIPVVIVGACCHGMYRGGEKLYQAAEDRRKRRAAKWAGKEDAQ